MEVPVGSNQKNAMTPMATVNTDNILFICGGAFPDLEGIIKERLTKKSAMGFGAVLKDSFDHDPDILSHVTNEDLRTFGMIPEFLGRLPITVTLKGLDKDMMIRILQEPKNAILRQYEKLLALDEVKLSLRRMLWSGLQRKQSARHRSQSAAGNFGGVHAGYHV
mgnify:CR=1 FL=1